MSLSEKQQIILAKKKNCQTGVWQNEKADKVSLTFRPAGRKKFKFVFPGGVYVGKNTMREESVFLRATGVQKCAVRSEAPLWAKSLDFAHKYKLPDRSLTVGERMLIQLLRYPPPGAGAGSQ